MNYLINLVNREPVRVAAFIRAVIMCAVGFGLKVTPEQLALVMVAVEALFAMIVRTQVSPNLNVENRINKTIATLSEQDNKNDPKI